ncbi:NmrA/HSCARG family protein [Streptomyces sp. NPDC054863]
MKQNRTVLVTGATGNQGGGTARALLDDGWEVRALVRDPDSVAARALAKAGAVLTPGNLDDAAAIERAVEGVYGVFSVQPLAVAPAELTAEVRRGSTLADAAAAAGVQHFVYSSVGGAERATGIDHFETKARIERHLAATSLATTTLRPTFFMNNLLGYADMTGERLMELPVDPGKPMQMIATSDIGRIAAAVLAQPEKYLGAQLEIAGDSLTFEQIAAIYQKVTDVPTRLVPQPIQDRMFEWFAESGYQADLDALRSDFPWLQRFDTFLRNAIAHN